MAEGSNDRKKSSQISENKGNINLTWFVIAVFACLLAPLLPAIFRVAA
jgi:hypothetical protein